MTATTNTLYRMFDAEGRLLYVGSTINLTQRFSEHHYDKPWWSTVAVIRLEHLPTRPELLAAEEAAIVAEKPLHNLTRRFRTEAQREESRRQRALPKSQRKPYEMVRRRAHRGVDDHVLQSRLSLARSAGVPESDIEWALAHPWFARYAKPSDAPPS